MWGFNMKFSYYVIVKDWENDRKTIEKHIVDEKDTVYISYEKDDKYKTFKFAKRASITKLNNKIKELYEK
jgi:hypothetical protein